jgi:predicted RNA-binding Zn ribbon-like protein
MDAHPGGHAHETDLETSLAFLNTLEKENGQPLDHLPDTPSAIAWFAEHGLVHPELATGASDRVIDRVRAVRGALRTVVDALVEDRAADPRDLATVNRALARRDALELVPAPDGARVDHRHLGDPIDGALARLADPVVALVASGDVSRLRVCANDSCRWVFYDTSRTAQRRWCDMATCGNRAKAARHRARVRELRPS